MTKTIAAIFKIINIIVVILYLSACLNPFLPAGSFWMIAILGLVFPIIACVVAFFFFIWLAFRSKWCFLSLAALILSWQQISVVTGFNVNKKFTYSKPAQTIRVFSWNVSSWSETNKNTYHPFEFRPFMLDLIKQQQADVICLQEFWDTEYKRDNYSILQIFKEMGYPYHYFVRSFLENKNQKMGVAIISKYPMLDTAKYYFGEDHFSEHLIYADIQFNNQKIRFFTTHLQSVRFEGSQYVALRKIKQKDESGLKGSRTIIHKLKNAYQYRGEEADIVKQKILESPYPVVICGDFNDVANSYTYFTIRGNLQDAFLKKGSGIGRTFQYLSPTLRIDYILADKKFKVEQYNRLKVPYSDHYPIVSDLNTAP